MNLRSEPVDPVAWGAARIALMAMRASIHPSMPLSSDAYALFAPDLRRMEARGLRWEEAQALCFTLRDERTLLLPVASVAEWDRDYERVLGGGWLDSVDNEVAADWPAYREARSTEAACVLRL